MPIIQHLFILLLWERHTHKKTDGFLSHLPCQKFCGKGGIRTPGTVTRTPHFECGPIDHSGTFPCAFCGANVRIYFIITTI